MKVNKKIAIFGLLIIILIACIIVFYFVTKNKDSNTEQINSISDNKEESQTVDNLIVDGIEYIDVSRNMKDVDKRNFTFYIDKKHNKNITFKYEKEEGKRETVELDQVLNYEDSIGAAFVLDQQVENTLGKENLQMVVSDENYKTPDGKQVISENKEKLWTEDGITCYVDELEKGFYNHQFVVDIDGIEVSIYCSYVKKDAPILVNGVKELIKHLSVDNKVGFYIDHFLNNYDGQREHGKSVIALKSYKLIEYVDKYEYAQINVNGFKVTYYQSHWSEIKDYEKNKLKYYKNMGDKKVEYYVSDYESDGLIAYIIWNEIKEDGSKWYAPMNSMFMCRHFNKYNTEPEKFLEELTNLFVVYDVEKDED